MRRFVVLWTGQLLSALGSSLTSFAVAVWIFQRTGSATPFILTSICTFLPQTLLAPVGGLLADRLQRKRLILLAEVIDMALTAVLAALFFAQRVDLWMIYVVAALSSSFAAIQLPAFQASIPMVVSAGKLSNANGLVQLSEALQQLLAPALAGVLVTTVGISITILVDFITFGFSIGAILLIDIPNPSIPSGSSSVLSSVGK